jgi:hypothetical protein
MWASLAALLGGSLLKQFTFDAVKYLALRAFLIGLIMGLGPVVLMKGFTFVLRHILEYVSTYIGTLGIQGIEVNVSGFGGWIVSQLRVGEALAIFLSFCSLSFCLRMLRVK